MPTQTPAQKQNALMTRYLKLYKTKYGEAPPGWNRNTAKWIFRDMLEDYGYDDSKSIIDYFFQCDIRRHPVLRLADLYGAMYTNMQDEERDRQERMRIRRETQERVNEYEARASNCGGSKE